MNDAQGLSVIVGSLLPPVMAVIIQSHWSQVIKSWVALLACVVAALFTTYFTGKLVFTGGDALSIGTNIALVSGFAWALYKGFWKTSGIAPAIEAKTNLPRIGILPDAPAPASPPAGPPAP